MCHKCIWPSQNIFEKKHLNKPQERKTLGCLKGNDIWRGSDFDQFLSCFVCGEIQSDSCCGRREPAAEEKLHLPFFSHFNEIVNVALTAQLPDFWIELVHTILTHQMQHRGWGRSSKKRLNLIEPISAHDCFWTHTPSRTAVFHPNLGHKKAQTQTNIVHYHHHHHCPSVAVKLQKVSSPLKAAELQLLKFSDRSQSRSLVFSKKGHKIVSCVCPAAEC